MDAQPIAYGGMIGESLLGLLATLACTAGFGSSSGWHAHYATWDTARGLATKIDVFIKGATTFITHLGIPEHLASALIAMVVVSFALTTLDSATRLLRFNIEEMGATLRIPWVKNRYISSLLACASIAFFAFYEVGGKPAALALWQLFGTTNQLLAGLTLILASLYLKKRGWPFWPTALPAFFMMLSTLVAMFSNLVRFASGPNADPLLLIVGGVLIFLGLWLVIESALTLRNLGHTDEIEIPVQI
jgi:carbon starvation protein